MTVFKLKQIISFRYYSGIIKLFKSNDRDFIFDGMTLNQFIEIINWNWEKHIPLSDYLNYHLKEDDFIDCLNSLLQKAKNNYCFIRTESGYDKPLFRIYKIITIAIDN